MLRVAVTVGIVLLVVGLVFVGYQVVVVGMGVSTALAFLYSQWRDVASDIVTIVMDNEGWAIVVLVGIVVVFLTVFLPKSGKK